MIDHGFEHGMARKLKRLREHLFERLAEHEQRPTRRHGSADAETFEDKAKRISENALDPRARDVGRRLEEYQAVLNQFWLYAENEGITARLTRGWLAKNLRRLGGLTGEEVRVEATFAMRKLVAEFPVSTQAPLMVWAWRPLRRHLDVFLAGMKSTVQLPRDLARQAGEGARERRVNIDDLDL